MSRLFPNTLSVHCQEAEQLLAGHEDNKGNINYENFVRTVMNG